jgi:hypothetical protein
MNKYEFPIKIRLQLDNKSPIGAITIIEDNGYDCDNIMPTTLKDIAVILWRLSGEGVYKTLCREISKELNIDYDIMQEIMEKIIEKYCFMDEKEAYDKTFSDQNSIFTT